MTGSVKAFSFSELRSVDDDGDGPAAVRSLMFGAAGGRNLRVTDEAGQRACHEGSGMPRRGDVAVVEHCGDAAQQPVVDGSALASSATRAGRSASVS